VNAGNTYWATLAESHIKLIGMAGIGAGAPTGQGCAQGERPDGLLVAERSRQRSICEALVKRLPVIVGVIPRRIFWVGLSN